jgi:hypothetical protein
MSEEPRGAEGRFFPTGEGSGFERKMAKKGYKKS